jgi:hypothetical protein
MASSETTPPNPDGETSFPVCFFLATLCALPFFILSIIGLVAISTKRQNFADTLALSVFCLPILIIVALCGLICIILTWKKLPRFRPLMVIYVAVIAAYWMIVKVMGPF